MNLVDSIKSAFSDEAKKESQLSDSFAKKGDFEGALYHQGRQHAFEVASVIAETVTLERLISEVSK
jgi:hypothetical protein